MENALAAVLWTVPGMPKKAARFLWPSLGRHRFGSGTRSWLRITATQQSRAKQSHRRKLPKNLRHPRRAKLPPDPGTNRAVVVKEEPFREPSDGRHVDGLEAPVDEEGVDDGFDDSVWSSEEIEVLSSLFERRMPQKAIRPQRKRPRPPPPPPKARPPGFPIPKRHVRSAAKTVASLRSPLCDRVFKNPEVLVTIAKEIGALPLDVDASEVLARWVPYLRKGSLSMTIRELGHMGLPERALQTLCWDPSDIFFFF